MGRLVTVIIPAYNAAATIDDTLISVRAQTWRALEILVIDDGSTDSTPERVLQHADQDSRVRLIRKRNAGVAEARNLGIAEARGDLVAPVDADDLWRPLKIEKQVAALQSGGDRVGLVYTWFSIIDERGRTVAEHNGATADGNVLRGMCGRNLVGNGSTPLMRRDVVREAGGYDPGLRAQGAEGCEDWKLYLSIAERFDFAVVREGLTGYRRTVGNMSSDGRRMLRSYDLAMAPFRSAYPRFAADFHDGRTSIIQWLLDRALRFGSLASALALYRELERQAPGPARKTLLRAPRTLVRHRLLPRRPSGRPFLNGAG